MNTLSPLRFAPLALKRTVLHTHIVDGKMVYVDGKGTVNPTIQARVGDTVEVELDSGEGEPGVYKAGRL